MHLVDRQTGARRGRVPPIDLQDLAAQAPGLTGEPAAALLPADGERLLVVLAHQRIPGRHREQGGSPGPEQQTARQVAHPHTPVGEADRHVNPHDGDIRAAGDQLFDLSGDMGGDNAPVIELDRDPATDPAVDSEHRHVIRVGPAREHPGETGRAGSTDGLAGSDPQRGRRRALTG